MLTVFVHVHTNMMVQFSSNESVILEKQIDGSNQPLTTKSEDIGFVYEISRCAEWIRYHGYKKVCLQFPDVLLPDSSEVAICLQGILNQTLYIMGDTAYESCCIDYIAAAHVNADAVIHFGPVCFSKASDNIPCLKIYEKEALNVNHFKEILDKATCNFNEKIAIIIDTPFLIHLDLIQEVYKDSDIVIYPIDSENWDLTSYTTIFIGGNQRKIMNLQFSFRPKELYYYDSKMDTPTLINYKQDLKVLKRRHFIVEKIKDSNTIGIIIGTLAVKNYLRVIERIKKLIKVNGKKYYVISVGKPTVAKLANFPEIDVYVVITCAMNEIYDSRDFYKPIVTPYDIELALNPEASNTQFSYDYNAYLPENDLSESELEHLKQNNDGASDVSLITGKIRFNKTDDEQGQTLQGEDSQIALKVEGTVAINSNFGAGYLSERSWKGLEQNLAQDKPQLAEEGRRGIAQGYANEKS